MDSQNTNIGNKIYAFRTYKGMTQEELAYFMGISVPTLISYEKGKAMPNAETIAKLSEIFNVSSDVFLNEDIELVMENEKLLLFRGGVRISDEERNKKMNIFQKTYMEDIK